MSRKLLFIKPTDGLLTMGGVLAKQGRGPILEGDLGWNPNGVMVLEGAKIIWVGDEKEIPFILKKKKHQRLRLKGMALPGFIDCHTHTVFAGDRTREFELKNAGVSYQEIASQGGGILSTVEATRKSRESELKQIFNKRLDYFLSQGVTTLEVKSGYGLDSKTELKILKTIKQSRHAVQLVSTYLGAHAIPKEFANQEEYLQQLKKDLAIIKKQKLSERVDIFVERGYFTRETAEKYFSYAKQLGFQLTVHADQMSLSGGTDLALKMAALSADHLVCVGDDQIRRLSQSNTTCVLLPAADFYSHCPYPPARRMIEAGCRVALSTDYNPGTSPTQNIQLVGLLARLMMKMSLPEVFAAWTVGAAYALGLETSRGALLPGFQADFIISQTPWREFFYSLRPPLFESVWVSGKKVL